MAAQLPGIKDPTVLKLMLSSVRLACRIFFSLNAPGVTPVSADSMLTGRALGAGAMLAAVCMGHGLMLHPTAIQGSALFLYCTYNYLQNMGKI